MRFQLGKFIVFALLITLLLSLIADYFNHTYIRAEFHQSEPMPAKMGVYYKGYRLGSTSKLKISKDFKTSYLYITLNQRGLHLPQNISVQVKDYDDDTKYVDIIYPPAPMLKYIKTGDIIKGESNFFGLDGISDVNQQHLDNLSAKGEYLLNSAAKTTESLTALFDLITEILSENRENLLSSSESLKNSMTNLETTTQNLKDLTQKANDEVTREFIRNSAQNLEKTTANFADTSKEFVSMSGNFNKTSSDFSVLVPQLKCLIETAQNIMCNINYIVAGMKETLKKRFGGARIIFGKAVK